MAYSYLEYTGDGSTVNFSYGSIDLFSNTEITHSSQLEVYVDGVLKTVTTDYTVDTVNERITFVSAPASSTTVKISRSTQISERYVDFENNSVIEEQTLDLDSNQLFFLIQEINDGLVNALQLDSYGYWNGQGHASKNCLPADSGSGWVTLGQMQDAIAGIDTATIDNAMQWSFTGDGSSTDFELSDLGINVSPEQLWVWVNGVIQKPGSSYDYDTDNTGADPLVTFTAAPATGDAIEVRAIHGTVAAILDEYDGDSITNYSIDPKTKLLTDAGDPYRVIYFGANGRVSSIGQMTAARVANLASTVQGYSLDLFDPPEAAVDMNSQQITGLAAGTASSHAVNKGQMDAAISAITQAAVGTGIAAVGANTVTLGWQPSLVFFITADVGVVGFTGSGSSSGYTVTMNATGFTVTNASSYPAAYVALKNT